MPCRRAKSSTTIWTITGMKVNSMISSPIAAEPLVRRPRRRAASFSLLLALAAGSVLAADKPTAPAPAADPPLAVPAPAASETKAGTGAAERWLLLVGQGKYPQSWDD